MALQKDNPALHLITTKIFAILKIPSWNAILEDVPAQHENSTGTSLSIRTGMNLGVNVSPFSPQVVTSVVLEGTNVNQEPVARTNTSLRIPTLESAKDPSQNPEL